VGKLLAQPELRVVALLDMGAMEAKAPGQFCRHAAAAAVAAPGAVPERVARLDGHEREALERPDRLLVNRAAL
jgi:hypothetical protein